MKRRDFITQSSMGFVTAGAVLSGLEAEAKSKEMASTSKYFSENNTFALPKNKEIMRSLDKARSGVHIGGIGAGGAELRKDGIFYNWSIMNNAPKGTGRFYSHNVKEKMVESERTLYPNQDDYVLFFIVRYKSESGEQKMKILQIDEGFKVAGVDMHVYEFPWMSGIEQIEYNATFPTTALKFTDSEMPFAVEITAWAPFIPHDIKNSSLPLMYFDVKITDVQNPLEVMITMNVKSLVGYDTKEKVWKSSINKTSTYFSATSSADFSPKASSYGNISFGSINPNTSYQLGWGHRHQYHEWVLRNNVLKNTDDTNTGRNGFDDKLNKINGDEVNFNSLAVSGKLNKGNSLENTFILTWNFPNLYDESDKNIIGHYYSNFFNTSDEVMSYAISNYAQLKAKTYQFLTSFYDSTAPQFVLNQVNSQLNTFITSGILSKKMEFGVLEGITQHMSWGPVGTTDVNMYGGVMVSSLFPELAKSTMKVHKILQLESGEIRHSFKKGFAEALLSVAGVSDRLDLHAQYAVMVLRDFFLTNDLAYLKDMWPSVKKALDYTISKRDLNGDKQPDMTGIMSSYDNFAMYGMAAYVQSQWLSALASALEAAKTLKDIDFSKKYTPIFESGKKLAEQKLWNGKYYRLYNSDLKTMKTKDGAGKEIIKDMAGVDEGCLTDQIIGQWAAHWSGLGDIFETNNRKTALKNILEMSYKSNFGLRNCAWPEDKGGLHPIAPDVWVDQANTCWSGVELSFASFLLYEGLYDEALKVIKTVDDRYIKCGRYFDHQEFGGHYFRPMGAWGIINGLLGLGVNQGKYIFSPKLKDNFKLFFSFPGGYGNVSSQENKVYIEILSGEFQISSLQFSTKFGNAKIGNQIFKNVSKSDSSLFDFKTILKVAETQKIELS